MTSFLPHELPAEHSYLSAGGFLLPKVTVAPGMGLALIGLPAEESASFHNLPSAAHRDPFDRMLAWQAIQRKLVMLTIDGALPVYQDAGLKTLWWTRLN